jgi:hypothetical protein
VLFGGGLFAFAVLALWVYCIFDVIATNEGVMRNLPKVLWLLIVIFVPTVGSIAWLLLGRPERAGFAPGSATYHPEPRSGTHDMSSRRSYGVLAPEDDPRFIADLDERTERLRQWEDDLKKREDELRRRGEDNPPG